MHFPHKKEEINHHKSASNAEGDRSCVGFETLVDAGIASAWPTDTSCNINNDCVETSTILLRQNATLLPAVRHLHKLWADSYK